MTIFEMTNALQFDKNLIKLWQKYVIVMISVQGKFLCNNITEGFTFFRYNRDTKFERGTKHWQKEWQVSIKKDVLPAEYVKILVRWQLSKFTMDVMLW